MPPVGLLQEESPPPHRLTTEVRPLGGDKLTGARAHNKVADPTACVRSSRYDEAALERSPYPQWMKTLASRERLLHPSPLTRLRLPDLLATVNGPNLLVCIDGAPSASPSVSPELAI